MVFTKLLTLTVPTRIAIAEEIIRNGWSYRGPFSGRTIQVGPNSEHAYRYMAQCFNRFQTAARRRWTYSYFRVVEEGTSKPYVDAKGRARTSTARVHYHLLVMCRSYMPQAELSRLARRAGLGRVVHITAALSDDDVSRYLAKYASKESGKHVPRGLRFYVMSRTWAERARASAKLRKAMERQAREAQGWRCEYVRETDVRFVAAHLDPSSDTAPALPPWSRGLDTRAPCVVVPSLFDASEWPETLAEAA